MRYRNIIEIDQGTQQTTSATYYYHYDLHGNVIRVTNSSGTTVIQYTYDQLGTIVSETNSSSIYNPFTYMGEAQIIHDDEFDTSGSTPKTGFYSSGSGYYNPHTGTFLGGSGAPASANPTSTSAEEPTAQSTRPASQLGAHAAISAVAGGVPSSKTVAASIDVSPAEPYQGINLYGELDTPVDASEDPMKWLVSADNVGYGGPDMDAKERERQRIMEYFRELESKWEEERRYKKEFDRYWNLTEEEREAERKIRNSTLNADYLTIEGRARAKIDNWDAIPSDVRDKIIAEELGRNPDIASEYAMLMAMGFSGLAAQYLSNWIKNNIVEKLEWAAWGFLESDRSYELSNNTLIVKKGYYLMGYMLKGSSMHLFWGPGRCSWTHHPGGSRAGTENLIGEEFGVETDAGNRGLACQWMDSWTSASDQSIGKVTLHSASNGEYVIGLTGIGIPGDVALYDLCTFKITNGTVIHDYYHNRWGGKPGESNDIILRNMLGHIYGSNFMFAIDLNNSDPGSMKTFLFDGSPTNLRFNDETYEIFRR